MDDLAAAVMARLDGLSPSQSLVGTFQRFEGAFALVTVLGADVLIPFSGPLPSPTDSVQLELRNGQMVMTGPTRPKPTRGRVTAVGSPNVTVLGSDAVSYSLPFMSSYSPTVMDDVAIEWSFEGGLVKGKVSTTPPPPVAPPAAGAEVRDYHPAPFQAVAAGYHIVSSGAYNGSFVPNYGTDRASAAWYGATVADSIQDNATITLARIYLSTTSQSFGGPAIQVIEGAGPQARVPVGSAIALPARSGWVSIPGEIVDLLKVANRGVSIIGATNPSGSDRYRTVAQDPMTFALDLGWRA
jgi:hypothetical protein